MKIDRKVYNPSRICKLYGTESCKGPNTHERPHRFSRVMCHPAEARVVPAEFLQALATERKQAEGPVMPETNGKAHRDQTPGCPDAETRVVAYLDKCEPAISGQNGHDRCFKVACKVGPGFDLTPETAFRLLRDHYNPRCQPPWTEKELRHKVDDAYARESRRGWLLNAGNDDGTRRTSSIPDANPYSGPQKVDHSGYLHLLRLFPSQPP